MRQNFIAFRNKSDTLAALALLTVFSTPAHAEQTLQQQEHTYFLENLRDPDSAKFRHEFMAEHGKTLCGEVNSKNAVGGYTGYKLFYVQSNGFITIVEGDTWDVDHYTDRWYKVCEPKAPHKPLVQKFDPNDGRTWEFSPAELMP